MVNERKRATSDDQKLIIFSMWKFALDRTTSRGGDGLISISFFALCLGADFPQKKGGALILGWPLTGSYLE